MKEMTLREVQLFGLDILKDVHQFCISNNIRYSLAYGTLIGAVRHKGFIPWDDDIDIIMPRPDYEKFCMTFKSGKSYKVFSPVMGDSYIGYARVCDLERTWAHSMPWCIKSPTGIWIDIFPIDGLDPEVHGTESDFKRLSDLNKKRLIGRFPKDNLSRPMPPLRFIRTIAKKVAFCWCNVEKTVSEYEDFIKSKDFNKSEFCGNRSFCAYYHKEKYRRSLFDDYIDIEFEGSMFKAIAKYDEYLRTIYGDYMKLPPIEKRVRHPQEMYWV